MGAMTQQSDPGNAELSSERARDRADAATPALVDEAEFESAAGERVFTARWQLFLPTAAILLLYSVALAFLHWSGRGQGDLARLVLVVLTVGTPLVAAHAFLRFETIRLQVLDETVRFHPGWPRRQAGEMPLSAITAVRIRRGLSGRLFGGGTLVLKLAGGQAVAIPDLADPHGARVAIVVGRTSAVSRKYPSAPFAGVVAAG